MSNKMNFKKAECGGLDEKIHQTAIGSSRGNLAERSVTVTGLRSGVGLLREVQRNDRKKQDKADNISIPQDSLFSSICPQ